MGNNPKLTPRARRTLQRAAELARARGHDYLGTEHLILALIDDPQGIAGGVMERLGYADAVRAEVTRIIESDGYSGRSRDIANADCRNGSITPTRRTRIAGVAESGETSRRDWHHLEALRASRRDLEARIADVESLGSRDNDAGIVASLDDHLVRLIATELAESAATVNREWELAALAERRGDLDTAMAHLANAYVQLNSRMPNQIEDVSDGIWQALDLLGSRLGPYEPPEDVA
jgi:ATP-dependent Clp protease ATP-binding subunit ClpA